MGLRPNLTIPGKLSQDDYRLLYGLFVLAASGHIAGVINPAARNKRNYWSEGEHGKRAERWLETAREVPGSWWSDWSAWLRSHAGTQVRARTRLGSAAFPEIEPAPGRYVTVRAA